MSQSAAAAAATTEKQLSSSALSDEEAKLRDVLRSRREEERLRNHLRDKSRRRRRSSASTATASADNENNDTVDAVVVKGGTEKTKNGSAEDHPPRAAVLPPNKSSDSGTTANPKDATEAPEPKDSGYCPDENENNDKDKRSKHGSSNSHRSRASKHESKHHLDSDRRPTDRRKRRSSPPCRSTSPPPARRHRKQPKHHHRDRPPRRSDEVPLPPDGYNDPYSHYRSNSSSSGNPHSHRSQYDSHPHPWRQQQRDSFRSGHPGSDFHHQQYYNTTTYSYRDQRGGMDSAAAVGMVDPFGRQRRPETNSSNHHSSNNNNNNNNNNSNSDRTRASFSRSQSPNRSNQQANGRNHKSATTTTARSRSRSVSSSADSSSTRSSRSTDSRSSRSSRSSSSTSSSKSAQSSSSSSPLAAEDELYSKDQRTVFVTQLVMRTTERDIAKFFRANNLKTNEIILLRDKRTGKHKGSAYVELKRMVDVIAAVNLSGQPPDFQRFPILIKASEAERNYVNPTTMTTTTVSVTGSNNTTGGGLESSSVAAVAAAWQPIKLPPLTDANGKPIQAQKVYVGNLEATHVTSQHLQALFSPFGTLTEIQLQAGKGFAFLHFHDPREAALAIQTMSGQVLAGRPIKTGWATNQTSFNGLEIVTSNEFPPDATQRAQNAYHVLAQLTTVGGVAAATTTAPPLLPSTESLANRVPTVADARASLAAAAAGNSAASMAATTTFAAPFPGSNSIPSTNGSHPAAENLVPSAATPDPSTIANADKPTTHVLVHNMYDKDEETEAGWETDIRLEFQDECAKYGKIVSVVVVSKEPGGKIYASFDSLDGAKTCASNLAGRWFDKRQLRVEYVGDDPVRRAREEYPL